MRNAHSLQPALAPEFNNPIFPSTRYQGSKAKIVDWIWRNIAELEFSTCLDAFGGTGVVAFRLKEKGKQVVYNDLLTFNYLIGRALIENKNIRIEAGEIDWLLARHKEMQYPSFIAETFPEIYFLDEENKWLDQTVTNINRMTDTYKQAIAFFALCQACIIKRPYNLFHRKNLYIRMAKIKRSFGNKTTWDRPFAEWFRLFIEEANLAVFDNERKNRASNLDALEVPGEYDLVYIDTPYISARGTAVDYHDFYHFLEGLTKYEEWREQIDYQSKHRRLIGRPNDWTDKQSIGEAFDRLFRRYQKSIIVVSYRSDGIPTASELAVSLGKYKSKVRTVQYGNYKYVLSTNTESRELLLIGT